MGITPSQEQVTAQLRIIIPALGTIVTAFGISQTQSNLYTQMILDSVGPISYLICGIWSLIANTRQSIIAKAAKPADANTPAPQIILPPQEAHIADALPANVTSSAVAVAKVLIIALALASLVATGSAHAAQKSAPTVSTPAADSSDEPTSKCLIPWDPLKLCGALTGKPEEDFQRVVKRIQAASKDDIGYAILKATAANTPASKVRLQCLQAISSAVDQFNGTGLKDKDGKDVARPDPAVITGIEDIAELVDNLSPQGVLFTSCAGAAQMFKTNTLALINAFVTGSAAIVAMPAGL